MTVYHVMYGAPAVMLMEYEDDKAEAERFAKAMTKQSPYKHWVEEYKPSKEAPARRKKAVTVEAAEAVETAAEVPVVVTAAKPVDLLGALEDDAARIAAEHAEKVEAGHV